MTTDFRFARKLLARLVAVAFAAGTSGAGLAQGAGLRPPPEAAPSVAGPETLTAEATAFVVEATPSAAAPFAAAPVAWRPLVLAASTAPGAVPGAASGDTPAGLPSDRPVLSERQLQRRGALIVGGAAAALLTYGYLKWWDDGLTGRLKWADEGWFGRGTEYGGIDKLGHAYSNALGVRLLGAVLEEAGYPRARATRLAFWSTTAAYAAIELLDGISRRYDASLQDMAFNLAGAATSALLMSDPALDRLIDFRLSYSRSRFANGWDAFGDYEGQTYWLVAKAEGVPALASNPLTRYLELSLGYGARNFDVPAGSGLQRMRELRLGVGINLSRVFGDAVAGTRVQGSRLHRLADLGFELVQHPLRVGGRWTD